MGLQEPGVAVGVEPDVPVDELAVHLDPGLRGRVTRAQVAEHRELVDVVAHDPRLADPVAVEQLLRRRVDLQRIDGLHEVVVDVLADRGVDQRLVLRLRDHDDGNVGILLLDPLQRLDARDARHHLVEDDEVEPLLGLRGERDRVLAVRDPLHDEAPLLQELHVRAQVVHLVVGPENALAIVHRLPVYELGGDPVGDRRPAGRRRKRYERQACSATSGCGRRGRSPRYGAPAAARGPIPGASWVNPGSKIRPLDRFGDPRPVVLEPRSGRRRGCPGTSGRRWCRRARASGPRRPRSSGDSRSSRTGARGPRGCPGPPRAAPRSRPAAPARGGGGAGTRPPRGSSRSRRAARASGPSRPARSDGPPARAARCPHASP